MDTIPRVARECRVHSVHPVMQRSNLNTNAEAFDASMHFRIRCPVYKRFEDNTEPHSVQKGAFQVHVPGS